MVTRMVSTWLSNDELGDNLRAAEEGAVANNLMNVALFNEFGTPKIDSNFAHTYELAWTTEYDCKIADLPTGEA